MGGGVPVGRRRWLPIPVAHKFFILSKTVEKLYIMFNYTLNTGYVTSKLCTARVYTCIGRYRHNRHVD